MFVIESETNSITALTRKTLFELGFKERKHLQEWLANNSGALGEKLLIIQKEFGEFAETYERLDLLALDSKGNLVIIENKLDDFGKKGRSTLFQNSSPTKDYWLVTGGANISGLSFQLVIATTNAQVLMNFGKPVTEENKLLFDALKAHQQEIESGFGAKLNWGRLNDKKSSRISYALLGVNSFVKEDWSKIAAFLIEHINKLEAAIKPYLSQLKKQLSNVDIEIPEDVQNES